MHRASLRNICCTVLQRLQGAAGKFKPKCATRSTPISTAAVMRRLIGIVTLALSTIDFSVGLRWQTWQRVEHEEILLQRILVTAKPV